MAYDFPMYINGEYRKSKTVLKILSPFDQHLVGQTYRPSQSDIEDSIQSAVDAFKMTREMPMYERVEKLQAVINDLYENKEARPLLYFADGPVKTIQKDEELAYQTLLGESLEGKNIFIECLDCPKELEVDGKGEIILEQQKNNYVQLITESENSQWLVFSESFLPGWQAYIDGQETAIYQVDSIYMGINIPKGEHRVLFEFSYPYL